MKDDLETLSNRFWDAYRALREAWLETGGGMDMELKIRSKFEEIIRQRRKTSAKKRAVKRNVECRK